MSRKKENYAYGSLKERLVIITVRQVLPRLSVFHIP